MFFILLKARIKLLWCLKNRNMFRVETADDLFPDPENFCHLRKLYSLNTLRTMLELL